MGAPRSLLLLAAGAASAAAALAASPASYETLRRRLGLADPREHFEDELPERVEDDTSAGELRLSLRARLAEGGELSVPDTAPPAEALPAREQRRRLKQARERLEAAAASASAAVAAPGDPAELEEDTAEYAVGDDGVR